MSVEKTMITDFQEKKLAEYLEPGGRYLVRFGHGIFCRSML